MLNQAFLDHPDAPTHSSARVMAIALDPQLSNTAQSRDLSSTNSQGINHHFHTILDQPHSTMKILFIDCHSGYTVRSWTVPARKNETANIYLITKIEEQNDRICIVQMKDFL